MAAGIIKKKQQHDIICLLTEYNTFYKSFAKKSNLNLIQPLNLIIKL